MASKKKRNETIIINELDSTSSSNDFDEDPAFLGCVSERKRKIKKTKKKRKVLAIDYITCTSSSSESEREFSILESMAENLKKVQMKKMIIEDLLSSSSSSSEEDDVGFLIMCKDVTPRISRFIADVVHNYSDEQFMRAFRLCQRVVYKLIDEYEESNYSVKHDHGGYPGISPEDDILSFLWFTANKCCLRDVADRFGYGIRTTFNQHLRVMNYLMSIAPRVITFPNNLEQLSESFLEVNPFPGVVGCIDGCYIPIITPQNVIKSVYVNRHDAPSLTLQAICDSKRRFLDVFTGPPSKMHDARVYDWSDLDRRLQILCGDRFHVLGDSAYPLKSWLLVPFRDYGNLTEQQKRYNTLLSRTRILIENAFGILKMRFRQLFYGVHMHEPEKMARFIVCCCVLHNLCIDGGDELHFDQLANQNNENENFHVQGRNPAESGLRNRERIMNEL